nr:hypothetical protein [Tanacetum cinerariifolium]
MTSIHVCVPAFLHKKNLRGYIKLLKIQVRLKPFKMQKVWILVDLPYGKRAIEGKSASTPIDIEKPLLKDPDGEDVDVNTYSCCQLLCTSAMDSESTAGLWVVLSGMEVLKMMLHVINISSTGYLTTQQMVLNSPCLTHIKNWLVHIKRSLVKTH